MRTRAEALQNDLPTPEMRLILSCCKGTCTEAELTGMREGAAGFSQWDSFLRLAIKNRVFPTACKNLALLGDAADPKTLRLLQAKCEQNRLAAIKLMAELVRVTERFDREGIRSISLKGPALGLALYGDLSLRTSKDLDLLVDRLDVEAAERILLDMGYGRGRDTASLTARQRRYILNRSHHFDYVSAAGIEVELHWRYDDIISVEFDDLWTSRKTLSAFGTHIDLPGDEENFLFLLVHGTRHGWKRLRWLLDIYEIVQKNSLDWVGIRKAAQDRGIERMLELAFRLMSLLWGQELPEGLEGLETTRPETLALARHAIAMMSSADGECEVLGHECYLNYKEYNLLLQQTGGARLRFLLAHFRPKLKEFNAVRINDSFFWLYYAVRPLLSLKRIILWKKAAPPPGRTG
jgi:hypothetical protein